MNTKGSHWSPRERFLAALSGVKPDRTPVAHVSALTSVENQTATGCSMPSAHTDPESLVRLSAANHEFLGFDAVSFIINYFTEPAALGCEMDWGAPNKLPMYLTHPWSEPEDAVIPADFLDRTPVKECLQTLKLAKQKCGDKIAVLGKTMGPLSMVQVMHGVENVMFGMLDEPDKIRRFLDVAADTIVKYANAQFELGIDALAIGEGGAGANMLSPEMHEEFLLTVHQKLIKAIDGPVVMHICGDITPRMRLLSQTGMSCFNFDWSIDPTVMKKQSQGKFRIMGNINTADLFHSTPDVIENQVYKCLDAGVDIISPGCAVSPECPNSNFIAMSQAVLKWNAERGSE